MGMKKLAALFMALMLCLTAAGAMAANVYEVDTLDKLKNAVASAQDGDTIKLTGNIQTGGNSGAHIISITQDVIIDLNGKTLSQGYNDPGLSVAMIAIRSGAEVTVRDSVGGGKMTAKKTCVQLQGTLNLESGTIACDMPLTNADIGADFSYPVWIYASAGASPKFNMTGGSLEQGKEQEKLAYAEGISVDETYSNATDRAKISINISGGNIEGELYTADVPQKNIAVTGGIINGVNYYPQKNITWDAPETGDKENLMMWVALMAMACMGLVVCCRKREN